MQSAESNMIALVRAAEDRGFVCMICPGRRVRIQSNRQLRPPLLIGRSNWSRPGPPRPVTLAHIDVTGRPPRTGRAKLSISFLTCSMVVGLLGFAAAVMVAKVVFSAFSLEDAPVLAAFAGTIAFILVLCGPALLLVTWGKQAIRARSELTEVITEILSGLSTTV